MNMARPQFTIRRLMLSTAMIAVGCLGITLALRFNDLPYFAQVLAAVLYWSAGIWVGAGVGVLFNRIREGAAAGIVLEWMIIFAMADVRS